ncbi:hypothetical protein [Saccharomonospora halophila]|uniref:hypothetical protein n=1 Tax=Saccharomonospora halophila TaxID=129922 RepID=UPI000364C401|nr:hypothetical protein [Saccharomonospora halophila]
MNTVRVRQRILSGNPPRTDHGAWTTVGCRPAGEPGDAAGGDPVACGGSGSFLTAPWVRLLRASEGRRIVVGQARVTVAADGRTDVTVAVTAVWDEADGWHRESTGTVRLDDLLPAALAEPAHPVPDETEARAVTVAKAVTEGSRNEVLRLRELRYESERRVADLLARRRTVSLRRALADVVELSMAVNRARDQAREALRERMHLWLWHPGVYDAPESASRGARRDADPPWMRTHRAALRHCEAIDVELAEEGSRLHGLLNSMSTFAVAQDGEAQQRFNLFAAVAAAGLGLPALILSFYGAEPFLPLNSVDRAWRALVPVAVTVLVAVLFGLRRLPGRRKPRDYLLGFGFVAALLIVLFVAGALAPGG